MILLKDQGNFVLELTSVGNQSTGVKDIGMLPFGAYLVGIVAKLGTAGVTGSQITDIHSITASGTGTTIFSNAAKITYTTTVDGALNSADVVAPVFYGAGTLFTLENDSVHSGTAAVNQKVILIFQRASARPALIVDSVANLVPIAG